MAISMTHVLNSPVEQKWNDAASASNSSVDAAQSGVNAVVNGSGQTQSAINNINAQAGKVNQQGAAVNATADQVKAQYDKLDPIAQVLQGYGDDLWNEGVSLSTEAKDVFGQGKALVSLDPSAGGLSAEYIKYWNSLSPDRYVSQATSDVNSSYSNALTQSQRALARRGVSASSGAYGALQKQYSTALATALAAAKTKARQTGLDQQASQLDKMVSAANTLYNMGNATEQNALAAKGQAVTAQGKSADVIATKGEGYAKAGSLQATAGNLFADAGNLFASAGDLNNKMLSLINSAYGNLSDAYAKQADTALGIASKMGGGGGSSTSSSRKSSSSDSDYDPWEATGHTSTWWANQLSSDEYQDMALQMAANDVAVEG
jgi:trimeric autotransporter adhesin